MTDHFKQTWTRNRVFHYSPESGWKGDFGIALDKLCDGEISLVLVDRNDSAIAVNLAPEQARELAESLVLMVHHKYEGVES